MRTAYYPEIDLANRDRIRDFIRASSPGDGERQRV